MRSHRRKLAKNSGQRHFHPRNDRNEPNPAIAAAAKRLNDLREAWLNPPEWAVGCRLIEGNGSRVRFEKDGHIATFHRPHPAKEAKPYQVRDARQFPEDLGVKP